MISDVMSTMRMAANSDGQASDMDFWKTEPAKVEAKRMAKRSAAKSKAAAPAQPSVAAGSSELPSGNEAEVEAPSSPPGLPADVQLMDDDKDDVPMSLPSPAESVHDEARGRGRGRGRGLLKRPAAASSAVPKKMKRPAAALRPVAPAAAPAAADEPPADEPSAGQRVLKIRGALKVVLEDGMTLGCPKCRDSKVGCGTCRRANGLQLFGGSWAYLFAITFIFLIH